MRLSFIGLAASISMLAACSHTPMRADASSNTAPPVQKAVANAGAQTHGVDQAQLDAQKEAARQEALRQQVAALNKASVLFDFDDYTVKSSYSDMLIKQAQFLKATGADHLTLQGNSDERGSAEYNLALGQKRAEAVRKALTLLGVSEGQIETVSFGKEKPKADCHDESCWSQNRRVDFVHGPGH
ncbi:MAG: peptidoglycan-associated lipoprotein Pal [Aquabacterium sp.]